MQPSASSLGFHARPQTVDSKRARRVGHWARGLSLVSAGLIAAGGYVHFCLYRHGYRFIPTIGPSFLLQFTSSALIAGALVFGALRAHAGRGRVALEQLTRLAGVGLAAGTLLALAIAHTPGGLFGFHEIGLKPAPQTVITIVVEWDAAVLLGTAMVCSRVASGLSQRTGHRPEAGPRHLSDAA